jgi:hypothetical protein
MNVWAESSYRECQRGDVWPPWHLGNERAGNPFRHEQSFNAELYDPFRRSGFLPQTQPLTGLRATRFRR